MKGYVVCTFMGLLAYDEKGNLLEKALFPGDPLQQANRLYALGRGEIVDEIKVLSDKLRERGVDELVFESDVLAKAFMDMGFRNVKVEAPNEIAKLARTQLLKLAVELGVAGSEEEALKALHRVAYDLSAKKMVEAVEKRDLLVAQAVSCIDEVEKMINILASRLREWYGVHFPELGTMIKDHEDYIRALRLIGHRDNVVKKNLLEALGPIKDKVLKFVESGATSLGADVLPKDIDIIREVASIALDLYRLNDKLKQYVNEVMGEVAPNLKELIGPVLGARLIALAGGLDRLAKLPASTIQLLGAEKALFRALRTGSKPPKHGIIFQHPEIHRSPRWQRGKIARALAGKIAIAARVDYFSGEYIADELKEDLRRRIKEIKETYKTPPKRVIEKKRKKEKRRKRGKR